MSFIKSLLIIFFVHLGQSAQLVLSRQFFTNFFTDNDCGSWTIMGTSVPPDHFFSQCGNQRIFGGYKKFKGDVSNPTKISRQYTGLIAHYAVRIQAKIYKIDSFINQNIYVMVDNEAQKIYNFQQTNSTINICGDPFPITDSINKNYNDSIISVDFVVNHNRSVLDLAFETDLNSNKGWWGVREVKVTLMLCDNSCKSCTNATACTLCDSSISGLMLIGAYCQCTLPATIKQLITQCTAMPCIRCVTTCSPGYYYSGLSTRCEPCNSACLTCTGPSNTVSPSCGPCADGFFRGNPATQPCYSCLGFCNTCNGLSMNACTSCKQGYFLLGTQCRSSCPDGTYPQENTRQCLTCNPSCLTCDGATGFHCTSCTGLLYLSLSTNQCLPSCNPPLFKYNNKCLQQCPLQTYEDFVLYTCLACVPNCAQCMDSSTCSKCMNNFFLLNSLCTSSCPTTHYQSQLLGECLICHSDCLECNGPTSSSCKVCSDGSKFLFNGSCVSECPLGTFSNTCQPCHFSCLQCKGPLENDCLSCSSPNFLDLNSSRCVQICPVGTIVDKQNFLCTLCPLKTVGYFHQCVSCSPTCETCFGTSFLQCLSCDRNSKFYMSTCISIDSSDGNIIKSHGKSLGVGGLLFSVLVLTGIICAVLQIFFTYKTPMLVVIEFIQILGYMYFFSINMSEQVQWILSYFYRVNFNAAITIGTQSVINMPVKIYLIGKTGHYVIDTLVGHILMILAVVLTFLLKKGRDLSTIVEFIFEKINPYLISYLYRFLILDQIFSLIIYLRYGGVETALGIVSLVIVLLDFAFLGLALLWKVRPLKQQDKKYFGIFYFNQIKPKQINSQNIKLNELQQEQDQNKDQKKNQQNGLLALLFYVGKIPFPLAIVIFINNGIYQAIAIFAYSLFFMLMVAILPYKRRIYRVLYIIGSFVLVFSSGIFLAIHRDADNSIILQLIWLIFILFIFIVTILQLVINYRFFIQIVKFTFRKIYQFLTEEKKEQHSEISNLDRKNDMHEVSMESIHKGQIPQIQGKQENLTPSFQEDQSQSSSPQEDQQEISEHFSESQKEDKTQILRNKQEQINESSPSKRKQDKKYETFSESQNKSQYNKLDESSFLTDYNRIGKSDQKEDDNKNDIRLDLDL